MNKLLAGAILSLLMIGCVPTQPTAPAFNPNNKSIVFVESKPFAIPRGAISRNTTLRKVTKGTGCRIGDVSWMSPLTHKKLSEATTKKEQYTAYTNAQKSGQLGCARPLSNKEYQYRLNQQNQRNANQRVQAQINQQSMNNSINTMNNMSNNMAIQNAAMANAMNNNFGVPKTDYSNTSWTNQSSERYKVREISDGRYRVKSY